MSTVVNWLRRPSGRWYSRARLIGRNKSVEGDCVNPLEAIQDYFITDQRPTNGVWVHSDRVSTRHSLIDLTSLTNKVDGSTARMGRSCRGEYLGRITSCCIIQRANEGLGGVSYNVIPMLLRTGCACSGFVEQQLKTLFLVHIRGNMLLSFLYNRSPDVLHGSKWTCTRMDLAIIC
jgi:hypothetical protein